MKVLEKLLVRALEDRDFLERLKREDYNPGDEYDLGEEEQELLKNLRFVQGGQVIDSFVRASSEAVANLLPQVRAASGGTQQGGFSRVEPKLERVAAKLERVEPKLQRVAPKLERVSPKLERVTPKLERVEPKLQRVAPKLERVEPKLQRVAPKLDRVEPKLERTAGKVERVSPKLERVASKLERGRS